jgi:hypothetical protein
MNRGTWALVLGVVACGADAKPVTAPEHPIASVTPAVKAPPPGNARWVFPTPASGVNDKVDIGGGASLLVGQRGRREIVKDGKATDASILVPDTIIGIMRDEQQRFAFVSDSGDVYISREPLGAFDIVRKGPVEGKLQVWGIATGRASAMIALSDGRVLRTADFGVSWKPVDYSGGTKLFGHAANFDLDHEGNGVLLHAPERVFVTHDDGATWKPIASPTSGARRCIDDARGGFLVLGYEHTYTKLVGDALVPTDEVPRDMSTLAVTGAPPSKRNVLTVRVLAGDHVLELERSRDLDKQKVRVRSTKLGDEPGAFVAAADLTTASWLEHRVAAYGASVVFLRTDVDANNDENTPTSTVMTSADGGATWKASATIEGSDPVGGEGVVAGPKGWAFVPGLCAVSGEEHERNCSAAKIRVAGGSSFEDMLFTEEFSPSEFAFDESHDKVYVVGSHGGRPAVYESRLGQNKFTPLATPLNLPNYSRTLLTVASDGAVRAFQYDGSKSAILVESRDAAGKKLPSLYIPPRVKADSTLHAMAFAGNHGVVMNGDTAGWETGDAGLTWTRVAANGATLPECSDAGCLLGEVERIGWDLPLRAESEVVTATAELPRDDPDPDPLHKISVAPPRMLFTCKASGTTTRIKSQPTFDNINAAKDVFWYIVDESVADKKSLAVGGRRDIRQSTLIDAAPALPKSDIERTLGGRWLADGFVAARYTHKPSQPVDVDLAAFSLETGRVQRASLPKLPSFRVASYGLSGEAQLVSGGLLFQSTDASPVSFIHDDGKIDHVSLPAHATLAQAQHAGNAWYLFASDDRLLTKLSWSTNNGASWQDRTWMVTDAWDAHVYFIRGGGRPWISTNMHEGLVLYPVTTSLPAEVPMPVTPERTSIDTPCDLHGPYAETYSWATHGETVKTTLDPGDKKPSQDLTLHQRLVQITGDGSVCTMGYVLEGGGRSVALYRDGKTLFGWSFRNPDDYKGRLAEPVTCTAANN